MQDPADGSDRLFFAHKNGTIQIRRKSDAQYLGTMLTLPADELVNDAEAGLVGFTLHPDFNTNGRFFIYRSCPATTCSVTCSVAADCGTALECVQVRVSDIGLGGHACSRFFTGCLRR